MQALPESGDVSLAQEIQPGRQPSLTWYIDRDTGRIRGTADGLEAVRQAAEIILNVNRFQWQIYRPYSGVEWDGLLGHDPGYTAAELRRRIWAALSMDDRITGISGFSYTVSGDVLTASLAVQTVYGETVLSVEVALS